MWRERLRHWYSLARRFFTDEAMKAVTCAFVACAGFGFWLRGELVPEAQREAWRIGELMRPAPLAALCVLALAFLVAVWLEGGYLDGKRRAHQVALQLLRQLYQSGRRLDASLPEALYAAAKVRSAKGSGDQPMDLVGAWDKGHAEWLSEVRPLLEERFSFGVAESVLTVTPPDIAGVDIYIKSATRRMHVESLERLQALICKQEQAERS